MTLNISLSLFLFFVVCCFLNYSYQFFILKLDPGLHFYLKFSVVFSAIFRTCFFLRMLLFYDCFRPLMSNILEFFFFFVSNDEFDFILFLRLGFSKGHVLRNLLISINISSFKWLHFGHGINSKTNYLPLIYAWKISKNSPTSLGSRLNFFLWLKCYKRFFFFLSHMLTLHDVNSFLKQKSIKITQCIWKMYFRNAGRFLLSNKKHFWFVWFLLFCWLMCNKFRWAINSYRKKKNYYSLTLLIKWWHKCKKINTELDLIKSYFCMPWNFGNNFQKYIIVVNVAKCK